MNEDTLVQQTTTNYLRDKLGWDSVYAYNKETFGPDGLLGRNSDREVVLIRYLRQALVELNPNLPDTAYNEAVRQVVSYSQSQSMLSTNFEKYKLFKDGVPVSFKGEHGKIKKERLKVFNFDNAEKNHFLAVRELWVKGDIYRRRIDIAGFVNGIPLLFIECKAIYKTPKTAYDENFSDYKDTIPHLFHHNAIVMLTNGIDARVGTITAGYEDFYEWKRLSESEPGIVDLETALKGTCTKTDFMDIFENFILFDDSNGKQIKVLAQNHQYLGVNHVIKALRDPARAKGKLGVFWHTQGAGKSYSMVFFTGKVHRKIGGNYTFLVCTDREDLDTQIYKTYAGCGLADNDKMPCRPGSGKQLAEMMTLHKQYVFTTIQKFNQEVDPEEGYTKREDIIVITDEAHRTQYGLLALNMRNALPNADFIGFTGTPLFKEDEATRKIFGDYISTYDFQRAVEDRATVPLYYDARGEMLGIATNDINERIAQKLDKLENEGTDIDLQLEKELKREYHILTAQKRLDRIAKDFVEHYSTCWETGKAMFLCIDKLTCLKMHEQITEYWEQKKEEIKESLKTTIGNERDRLSAQLKWMDETRIAVIVSEEQGEVEKFKKSGFDITPHRRLIKNGFELPDGTRIDVESAFKKEEHPFRIAIVCAMWLTGFNVPSLANLYLDKPLKEHTLMQAIARANRVNKGKNNGLIIDYCGILKNLRAALAIFAGTEDRGRPGGPEQPVIDPTRPQEELLDQLKQAIALADNFLIQGGASLETITNTNEFERNKAIALAKEAVNLNDESRKKFEAICREVFIKFKACLTIQGVNTFRKYYKAIDILYKSLQKDREFIDITEIFKQFRQLIDESIVVTERKVKEATKLYDISKIDFTRLRTEFEKIKTKNTVVQSIKSVIEQKLSRLIKRNPLRTNFQEHYEKIIEEYNKELDRKTIEETFEALIKFVEGLDEEENRAVREGMDEETLAIYDLLAKKDLNALEIKKIKRVAEELLKTLKTKIKNIHNWKDKDKTRADVEALIRDVLYREDKGLPLEYYSEEEVLEKSNAIYLHVYRAYPVVPSPLYAA